MSAPAADDAGFTVIEALVALAILAIAAVGIIRAAEAHIDTLHELERRSAAQWAADNALAEMRLGLRPQTQDTVTMLGERWTVRTALGSSADRDLQLAIVQVAPAGQAAPMVSLRGFVDRGTVTP